jgi:hypothetical protein
LSFPELVFLENLLTRLPPSARVQQLAAVSLGRENFPLYSICLGNEAPGTPTLALVGGVHGQEKIGTQVVLSYLETFAALMEWDETTHDLLKKVKIAFYPIVNPVGMFLLRRGNANRVDLMRNAPGEYPGTTPLVGGQRFSPLLPWYRGKAGAPMELEAQALCEFVRKEVFPASTAIALDCHSGYGTVDRLWFPYGHTALPFPQLAETYALKTLLDRTYPNHVYLMEPGASAYTIQGDIWDCLYTEQRKQNPDHHFLPLTLEMGSWLWLKKNPIQMLSPAGLFQPMHLHRHKRVLRRHLTLLDFFQRAVISPRHWANLGQDRIKTEKAALEFWELGN